MMQRLLRIIVVPALVAAAFGCAKSNADAPAFDGGHPAGWIQQHGEVFLRNSDQCRACHGDDLKGGIAGSSLTGVSGGQGLAGGCYATSFGGTTCHSGTGPWAHPEQVQVEEDGGLVDRFWYKEGFPPAHPRFAMDKPVGYVANGVPTGFPLCQDCHGENYAGKTMAGPVSGASVQSASCVGCHNNIFSFSAPHTPPIDWVPAHQGTNPDNARGCKFCHYHDTRPELIAAGAFAPEGTPVGCFNGTLCHFIPGSGHPTGAEWTPPSIHGAHAKAFPNPPTDGFLNCRQCHGPTFTAIEGKCAGACHTPPHADDWRGTGEFTHQNTDQANAPACEPCHSRGQNSPITLTNPAPAGTQAGCFNSTLCHGAVANGVNPHPAGWSAASAHGAAAVRTTPAKPFAGLINCNDCHGPRFSMTCAGECHRYAHPNSWRGGHRSILQAQGVLQGCAVCHGRNAGTPGCFNGTLCHTGNPD
jgi:hypothetical protein